MPPDNVEISLAFSAFLRDEEARVGTQFRTVRPLPEPRSCRHPRAEKLIRGSTTTYNRSVIKMLNFIHDNGLDVETPISVGKSFCWIELNQTGGPVTECPKMASMKALPPSIAGRKLEKSVRIGIGALQGMLHNHAW